MFSRFTDNDISHSLYGLQSRYFALTCYGHFLPNILSIAFLETNGFAWLRGGVGGR